MTATDEFEATLGVVIRRKAGEEIGDRRHVLNWVVADGHWLDGKYGGFDFQVCPEHPDPEDCDCPSNAPVATYTALVMSAGLE